VRKAALGRSSCWRRIHNADFSTATNYARLVDSLFANGTTPPSSLPNTRSELGKPDQIVHQWTQWPVGHLSIMSAQPSAFSTVTYASSHSNVAVSTRESASPSHSRPHSASSRSTPQLPYNLPSLPPRSSAGGAGAPTNLADSGSHTVCGEGASSLGFTLPAAPLAVPPLRLPHRGYAQTATRLHPYAVGVSSVALSPAGSEQYRAP
jgi:hypothetical protein